MMHSTFSVSKIIKEGAQKTFDHIVVLIKGLFFAFVAVMCVAAVLAIINLGLGTVSLILPQILKIQECGVNAVCIQAVIKPLFEPLSSDMVIVLLSLIAISIGISYMTIGYLNYALRVYDNGNAGFSDLFPSFGRVVKILIALFIFGLIVSCGLVFLIIPGIYFVLRFGLFTYFILDKNVGIFDSLKMSWHITRGCCWELLALLLFALLLHMLGNATIIGWVFAIPMIYVTKAVVYRRLTIASENNQNSAIN